MMKSQIVRSGNAAQAASKSAVETSASAWMTIQDAATYLGVGVDKIYEACAGGGLRHARFGHRTIRLRREWIDRWADSRARELV